MKTIPVRSCVRSSLPLVARLGRPPCARGSACPRLSRPLVLPCPSMTHAHTATERARENKKGRCQRKSSRKERENVGLLTHTTEREGRNKTPLLSITLYSHALIIQGTHLQLRIGLVQFILEALEEESGLLGLCLSTYLYYSSKDSMIMRQIVHVLPAPHTHYAPPVRYSPCAIRP